MVKRKVILIVLAVLAVAAVVIADVVAMRARAQRAERQRQELQAAVDAAQAEACATQAAAYAVYARMAAAADEVALIVTEQGKPVAEYTPEQLGLRESLMAQIDNSFDDVFRIAPDKYAATPNENQLLRQAKDVPEEIRASVKGAQLQRVVSELEAMPRTAPKDACVVFANGAYRIEPEREGTVLRSDMIEALLKQQLPELTITADGLQAVTLELTDYDCYVQPELTLEEAEFDYAQLFAADLQSMSVTLRYYDAEETLTPEQLDELLDVSDSGELQIDEAKAAALIQEQAAIHMRYYVPYVFDSYLKGPVELAFLPVNYVVDEDLLVRMLKDALLSMESGRIEAPYTCTRNGAPFSLGEEYIEVDIDNQVMTYFKDGEVFVTTDVVTGASWLSVTPRGLYQVENKDANCWLSGPDYTVFVECWIGFIGVYYGIHDASWRTEFGGDVYLRNGSHGCVNTPTESVKKIYENVEIGVPVLVHGT